MAFAVAVIIYLTVGVTSAIMEKNITDFYRPIKNYNLIVEKQASLVQFIPVNSIIEMSTVEALESKLNTSLHPTIFLFNESKPKGLLPTILMGARKSFMEEFVSEFSLVTGRFPDAGKREVLVSSNLESNVNKIGANITFLNKSYSIVGLIRYDNLILDNIIMAPLDVVQDDFNLENRCHEIFMDKINEVNDQENVENLVERDFPELKFLKIEEIDDISNSIIKMMLSWNQALFLLTMLIITGFALTAFFLNYQEIKKKITLLKMLGTKQSFILFHKFIENLLIINTGYVVGAILTNLLYPILVIVSYQREGHFLGNLLTAYPEHLQNTSYFLSRMLFTRYLLILFTCLPITMLPHAIICLSKIKPRIFTSEN